jgi:hypothetical protein
LLIAFGACSGELLQSLSDCKTLMLMITIGDYSDELLQSMEDCKSGDLLV